MVLLSARAWFASICVAFVAMAACSAVDGGGAEGPDSADPFRNEEVEGISLGATKPTGTNGDTNYCDNPAAPCTVGEGDCDNNSHCAVGLACIGDNGSKFGFTYTLDMCAGAHCNNGIMDGDETAIDCGGSCSSPGFDCATYCPNIYWARYPLGSNNHCTAACPCPSGEGDCDGNTQCQSGLVCANNNGNKFGFPGLDFCVPATCRNGVLDAGEERVDCGGACSTIPCAEYCSEEYQTTYPNGHNNHCSVTCPCASGQGDCDGDVQCQSGLVCINNNGAKFGFPGHDFCAPATCRNGLLDAGEEVVDCGGPCSTVACGDYCSNTYQVTYPNGHNNHCTTTCPCAAGEGDCDSHAQCQPGLVCVNNNGNKFGFPGVEFCVPPTCTNGVQDPGEDGVDCGGSCSSRTCAELCGDYHATYPNGHANHCTVACPCVSGEGDCDSDAQCQAGLVCGAGNSIKFGFAPGSDHCVPPSCVNGMLDVGETAVDCGGQCGNCGQFAGLGDLPGGLFASYANSVSADGAVIVGRGTSASGSEAFRWTANGGMIGLGDLAGGAFSSVAHDVSNNGAVIVGQATVATGDIGFRWTVSTGMVSIGDLPGGAIRSEAYAVSANGGFAVGPSTSANGQEAFRYYNGVLTPLGDLAGGPFASQAWSTSSNGAVVVGRSQTLDGWQAFRWTAAAGMVGIGELAGGGYLSHAMAVNYNGSVIGGYSASGNGIEGFRWMPGTGMVGLGHPAGMTATYVYGMDDLGNRLVGTASDGVNNVGFLWTTTDGMQTLQSILQSQGGDLSGWTILGATAISGNGKVIVGYGTNPNGDTEAFRAVIP